MGCFTGLCTDHVAKHMALKPSHTMYTCIRELPEEKPANGEEEEVRDVYKLGALKPKVYEHFVCCGECRARFDAVPELAVDSYSGIVNAPVPGAQATSNDEGNVMLMRPQCPHLVCLEQTPSPFPVGSPPTSDCVCSFDGCGCRVNNWMCVTCGAIGCPRAEAGGQGHALKHFELTGHPVVVKLGTVTPECADYYCYDCDDDVADVHFKDHMKHFGIDIATAKKTAQTMGEMQYDYSTQFDFNAITEAGSDLVPAFGAGHTGIRNIGSSCYIAAVVQCLAAVVPFQRAFYPDRRCEHQRSCANEPYNCHTCQTERLMAGLLSGEFSKVGEEQRGVVPRLFKGVYAQKHPEFATGQQQDAHEYFLYLLEEMRRFAKPTGSAGPSLAHPCDVFEILMEHRAQCTACQRVRYTYERENCLSLPIPHSPAASDGVKRSEEELNNLRPRYTLDQCLAAAIQPDVIDCRCAACGTATTYLSTTRLGSFPDILAICLRRTYFDLQALTTVKMDVYVDAPQELDLSAFRGSGRQPDEVEMPTTAETSASAGADGNQKKAVEVDETALAMVISMGFDAAVATYALRQTDMNVERAVEYIFSRPEIEAEMMAASTAPTATKTQSPKPKAPLTDGSGTYKLFAMISHIGSSAKVGHYVCHIKDRETGKWLLFNDEKVGESQNPPFAMASLLFYQRSS